MQENVKFFDTKLHKNAYFTVCKVHKSAKSVISMGQNDKEKWAKCNLAEMDGEKRRLTNVGKKKKKYNYKNMLPAGKKGKKIVPLLSTWNYSRMIFDRMRISIKRLI